MSAPECQKDRSYLRLRPTTCIEALSEGWILATDLCPACTRAFMAALDGIDKPLKWHANYLDRAK